MAVRYSENMCVSRSVGQVNKVSHSQSKSSHIWLMTWLLDRNSRLSSHSSNFDAQGSGSGDNTTRLCKRKIRTWKKNKLPKGIQLMMFFWVWKTINGRIQKYWEEGEKYTGAYNIQAKEGAFTTYPLWVPVFMAYVPKWHRWDAKIKWITILSTVNTPMTKREGLERVRFSMPVF